MKAIILAGGYSKRLWPLTTEIPKSFLEFNGKPVIDHIMEKIDAVKDALKSEDTDKIKKSADELSEAIQKVGAELYGAANPEEKKEEPKEEPKSEKPEDKEEKGSEEKSEEENKDEGKKADK